MFIIARKNIVVVIVGDQFSVHLIGSNEKYEFRNKPPTAAVGKVSSDERDDWEGDAVDGSILAAALSPSGRLLAASDDSKRLMVWTVDGVTLTSHSTRSVARRCTALTFTPAEDRVLVADKSGDVFSFSLAPTDLDLAGILLMGHVSMLLDLRLCEGTEAGHELLVTCDRDEKIRVSRFPNSYNITAFCLGHTDYVHRLEYIQDDHVLLSASGDGTVRAWDYRIGRQLSCVQCAPPPTQGSTHLSAIAALTFSPVSRSLVVSFHGSPKVKLYTARRTAEGGFEMVPQCETTVDGPVCGVTFDDTGRLWMLVESAAGQWMQVFKVTADAASATHQLVPCSDVSLTTAAFNTTSSLTSEISRESSKPSLLSVMRKVHIDNVGEYYEKKQQRLKKNRGQTQPRQKQQQQETGCTTSSPDASHCDDSSDAKRHKLD